MAPTEASILANFLLPPSSLPNIMTLQKFTELFPRAKRSSPEIASLYRELQHQRGLVTDQVKNDIIAECRLGERQRREVARARRKAEREELEGTGAQEMEVDLHMFGPSSNLPAGKPQSLSSILAEMRSACADVEKERAELDTEADATLAEIKAIVDGLSDLRYGRFSKPVGAESVREEILEGLRSLENVCDSLGEVRSREVDDIEL
ncbi:MAG: hypothetical protein M1829_006232 [Trizodia sp. TS-e1964]|nr:MAG: hypothetical protein M1829_006232 [Trizodia sp. TS-e1964]